MEGKLIIAALEKIENGQLYEIFRLLPDIAGGEAWRGEVQDCAQAVQDYINAGDDYELDDLRDYGWEFASGQCETYYKDINDRVQELALWASNELDDEVAELNQERDYPSLTDLNAQYLCSAMRMLWDAVIDQAFENAEEVIEVSA